MMLSISKTVIVFFALLAMVAALPVVDEVSDNVDSFAAEELSDNVDSSELSDNDYDADLDMQTDMKTETEAKL